MKGKPGETKEYSPSTFLGSNNRAMTYTQHPAREREVGEWNIILLQQRLTYVFELYQFWEVRTRQLTSKYENFTPFSSDLVLIKVESIMRSQLLMSVFQVSLCVSF